MGTGPEVAVPIGHQIRESGIEVVEIIQQPQPDPYASVIPSKTAVYEARHAVIARKRGKGVKGATARPGPGYLGATWLDEFDPVTAMAHPGDGDGHDRAVVIWMGYDPGAAAATARGIINENHKQIMRVAKAMESKGTLGRHDIDHEISEAEKKPENNATAVAKTEDGSSIKIETKLENGKVKIPKVVLVDFEKRRKEKKEKAEREMKEQKRLAEIREELAGMDVFATKEEFELAA